MSKISLWASVFLLCGGLQADLPQIRGVLVPLQETPPIENVAVEPAVTKAHAPTQKISNDPPVDVSTPPPEIRGTLIPVEEVSVKETPRAEEISAVEEPPIVEEAQSSSKVASSSKTIIFSAPEVSPGCPIEVVEQKENKKADVVIKRNVFANIAIATISAVVICLSAFFGSS